MAIPELKNSKNLVPDQIKNEIVKEREFSSLPSSNTGQPDETR